MIYLEGERINFDYAFYLIEIYHNNYFALIGPRNKIFIKKENGKYLIDKITLTDYSQTMTNFSKDMEYSKDDNILKGKIAYDNGILVIFKNNKLTIYSFGKIYYNDKFGDNDNIVDIVIHNEYVYVVYNKNDNKNDNDNDNKTNKNSILVFKIPNYKNVRELSGLITTYKNIIDDTKKTKIIKL